MRTHKLSQREQDVLQLIAQEYTGQEIAKVLYLSPHTVHSHKRNLMQKLGVRNAAGLVRVGFELGILKIEQKLKYVI